MTQTDLSIFRAGDAQGILGNPYWRERIAPFLSSTVQAETETVLDPTQGDKHAIARASVAICRRVLMLPHIDIEQGQQAEKAIENYQAKTGWILPFKACNSAER